MAKPNKGAVKTVLQPTLWGYSFDNRELVLELIALGLHENFYLDIQRGS